MTKHFYQLGTLTVAVGILAGCGGSAESDTNNGNSTITAKAREAKVETTSVSSPANPAELNRELATKMTFGNADEIAALLQNGATTAAKNRYGLPVIFMAAERGDVAILNHLIAAGADVNSQIGTSYNDDGLGYTGTADGTPLSYAAAKGNLEAMQVLHEAGADVNGKGPEGATALLRAAESGKVDAVKWLLDQGATEGRSRALGAAQMIVNPNEDYQQIIALLTE